MTINPMYAQMGLSVGQGITGFINQGTAASLAASLQKYRNRMLEITAAMERRTITLNQVSTRDATMRLSFDLQKQAARDQGAATVSAAAAGVQGGSVDATMRGLRQSALNAQAARKARYRGEMRQHFQDGVNLNVGTIMGKDIQVHPRPSILSAAVGIGGNLLDDFDRNQPAGDKLGDRTLFGGDNPIFGSPQVDWWETTNFHS